MALELFWFSGSPYAWRVQLALLLKRVPYTSRLLERSLGEHRRPEYLALNPRGRVPTVRDGEVVVVESLAILAWLDRRFPDPPLFGTTAAEAAAIWRVISEYTSYLDPAVEDLILPVYDGELPAKADQVRRAAAVVREELSRLEAELQGPWLAEDGPTAADVVVYPHLRSVLRAAAKPAAIALDLGLEPFAARWPGLAAWMARFERLPGFATTWPPHWRIPA